MSAHSEEIWRVLDGKGRDASGYNNVAGLYLSERGAKAGKRHAESLDQRRQGWGHKTEGPYTVQHGVITWEETESGDHVA